MIKAKKQEHYFSFLDDGIDMAELLTLMFVVPYMIFWVIGQVQATIFHVELSPSHFKSLDIVGINVVTIIGSYFVTKNVKAVINRNKPKPTDGDGGFDYENDI